MKNLFIKLWKWFKQPADLSHNDIYSDEFIDRQW